jgi:hypothetical protein
MSASHGESFYPIGTRTPILSPPARNRSIYGLRYPSSYYAEKKSISPVIDFRMLFLLFFKKLR